MTTFTLAGHQINVHTFPPTKDQAQKGTILMVHSSGLNGLQWIKLAKQASDNGYTALAVDLIGYGTSEAYSPDMGRPVDRDTMILRDLVRQTTGPVHMVGHSYGGFLCLQAATAALPNLKTLSLYEPVAFSIMAEEDKAALKDRMIAHSPNGDFTQISSDDPKRWMARFIDFWNEPGTFDALPPHQKAIFTQAIPKTHAEVCQVFEDVTPLAAYQKITQSILAMNGSESPYFFGRVCETLGADLPTATHKTLYPLDHMGPITKAAVVNDHILTFIERYEHI